MEKLRSYPSSKHSGASLHQRHSPDLLLQQQSPVYTYNVHKSLKIVQFPNLTKLYVGKILVK